MATGAVPIRSSKDSSKWPQVRSRLHVNPLSAEFAVLPDPPCWAELLEDVSKPMHLDRTSRVPPPPACPSRRISTVRPAGRPRPRVQADASR
eukprot:1183503-Prorocentrum_minimum.AAC.1